MTAAPAVDPASIDLDAYAPGPEYRVEPLGPRAARPGVRVWHGEALLAADCTSEHHDGSRLTAAEDLVAHRRKPGGRDLVCRACKAAIDARRDREAMREYTRARRQDPAVRERDREYNRTRRARLAARSDAEILAKRAEMHPDGVKRCESCRETLPLGAYSEHRSNLDGLRRDCRACAHADLWRAALPAIEDADTWDRCSYCGAPADDVDHVVPVSAGGTDAPGNLTAACWECNRGPGGKFARPVLDWLPERFPALASFI